MGDSIKLIGKGLNTGQVYEPILNAEQLAKLETTPEKEPFDGDAMRFRLGVEALRLALAYEYDPYFSLSIARVDPLPHQLEAVYDYFMKLPRIRFLLADDPGAGKTIMAGLLIKELKIRGLIKRTLIVTPANLSFQWQREMKDKFRENQERNCAITDIHHQGRAWVLPHPERTSPGIAPMVRDEEIERIAVQAAIAYEESRGWIATSVEQENRGFDLISRRPHPEDPQTAVEVRFIEVKGRAAVGEIALTTNEYKTAERLKNDYWLYAVFNCASTPEVHAVQDPARLGWQPIVKIEHYHVGALAIMNATTL